MGIERRVEFAAALALDWPRLVADLASEGQVATLRMIDDSPAFPDEVPPPEWRELRLGFAAGMVTVRRAGTALVCVVWGAADAGLTAAQTAVAVALAGQGGGVIPPRPG